MADIEGSEYTRLSCSELDRLLWLAQCCGGWRSGGGKVGLQQADLTPSRSVSSKGVCACVYLYTVYLSIRVCRYEYSSVCSLYMVSCIIEGLSSPLYTGCVSSEAGMPASCKPLSQLVFLPGIGNLALCLFLFHVVITYVYPQGSLSTHQGFYKWDMTHVKTANHFPVWAWGHECTFFLKHI